MKLSSEAAVVLSLKRHLLERGFQGGTVTDLLVDADASYRASAHARALEPMATVRIAGFRPDLLCRVDTPRAALVAAFEVKARPDDWQKGLTQARAYRRGAHHSYLALPEPPSRIRALEDDARESGVGLLVEDGGAWRELLAARDPRPTPWDLETAATALRGVPGARQLQLNHPLNYLVVPLLRVLHPELSAYEALEAAWPDLRSPSSRGFAVDGARTLHLLDRRGEVTADGLVVAELLLGVGFTPETRVDKRPRLDLVAPGVAAVARAALLRQPAVRLILETLLEARGHALAAPDLFLAARRKNEILAGALFLSDPGLDAETLEAGAFNPSTPFKLKQNLWHAGILATKAHPSAGKAATVYQPREDLWALDERFAGRVATLGG